MTIVKHLAWLLCVSSTIALQAQTGPNDARAREIYKELVEINTTDTPAGNVTKAAEAMAARLKAAGFPAADIQVLGPDPKKGNLVFRYRGTGAAQAASPARPPRRRRSQARGLVDRSVHVPREGRLLLRPRHQRRQGDGRRSSSPTCIRLKAGRLHARSRSDPGAHRRRGRRRLQRRRLAGQEPQGSDRRRVRHQRGRRRQHAQGQVPDQRGAGQREGVPGFPPRGDQPGRTQLAAGQGQRDLPPRRRPRAAVGVRLSRSS